MIVINRARLGTDGIGQEHERARPPHWKVRPPALEPGDGTPLLRCCDNRGNPLSLGLQPASPQHWYSDPALAALIPTEALRGRCLLRASIVEGLIVWCGIERGASFGAP